VVIRAPLAVKAIHDAHYAVPPASWSEYQHRLQYLSEMAVGKHQRSAARAEDAAVKAAMDSAEVVSG
jgi:hypothetical protein